MGKKIPVSTIVAIPLIADWQSTLIDISSRSSSQDRQKGLGTTHSGLIRCATDSFSLRPCRKPDSSINTHAGFPRSRAMKGQDFPSGGHRGQLNFMADTSCPLAEGKLRLSLSAETGISGDRASHHLVSKRTPGEHSPTPKTALTGNIGIGLATGLPSSSRPAQSVNNRLHSQESSALPHASWHNLTVANQPGIGSKPCHL